MARNVEKSIDAVNSMLDWGKAMEKLLESGDMSAQDSLEDLGYSLASGLKKLEYLRLRLSKEDEADIEPAADSESTGSPQVMFRTIPELKFVPWREASSVESPPPEHFAIQIPFAQPTADDLSPSKPRRKVNRTSNNVAVRPKEVLEVRYDTDCKLRAPDGVVEKPRPFARAGLLDDSRPLEELPDRIRICSQILSLFLDYNIHDGSLNWSSYERTPFIILRPFKFLVYNATEIRTELANLEQIRHERSPSLSEEDHDRLWKKASVEDDIPPLQVVPEQLEANLLTALIKDLRCLTRFMDGYIEPTMTIDQRDHVFFTDLWFVFSAKSLIYIKDKKVPQKIWKVIQRTGGRREWRSVGSSERVDSTFDFSPFVIDCFHLDYDGTRYVHTYRRIKMDYFEGTQPLTSLPVMPIGAAEKAQLVDRRALVERGQHFVKLTRPRHGQYVGRNQIVRPNGTKLHETDTEVPENITRYAEWIESEVMVDFENALQEIPGWRPGINDLDLYKGNAEDSRDYKGIELDSIWDRKSSERVLYDELNKCQRWDKERTNPTEEADLLLLPDRVFAFVFRIRKWACLQIGKDNTGEEMLRDKISRSDPWNDLQLPDGHKRLVQSLIEAHFTGKGTQKLHFDLVRAKGRGVTILLHGVPGVGKTSTAECVAEANKRPLLPITCGDLGLTPKEVEKKLEQAFQLAQQWDCVLLLDEADIFLAQRSEKDIERNALVSVFLRVLEYYEGILFLTTNRVGVFDEAFKSRIHLPLYYPPLEWKQTEKIWRTHLRKLESSKRVLVDVEDIVDYASTFFVRQSAHGSKIGPVWNGRQIRNAFQSAVALAGHTLNSSGAIFRLEREHFKRVSEVSNEFNYYIWSINCQTDADKASRWGYRHDSYQTDETIHMNHVPQHHQQTHVSVPSSLSSTLLGMPGYGFGQHGVAMQQQQQQPPLHGPIPSGLTLINNSLQAPQPSLMSNDNPMQVVQPPQGQGLFSNMANVAAGGQGMAYNQVGVKVGQGQFNTLQVQQQQQQMSYQQAQQQQQQQLYPQEGSKMPGSMA